MSGFAALDPETQESLFPGDLKAQAEYTYDSILQTMARRASTRRSADHRRVRLPDGLGSTATSPLSAREKLRSPYPASTGIVCGGLLRDEFLLEVVPTATYPMRPALTPRALRADR